MDLRYDPLPPGPIALVHLTRRFLVLGRGERCIKEHDRWRPIVVLKMLVALLKRVGIVFVAKVRPALETLERVIGGENALDRLARVVQSLAIP